MTADFRTGLAVRKDYDPVHPVNRLDEVVAGLRQSKADGLGTQGNREIVTDSFIEKLTVYRNPMRKRGI